MKVKFLYQRTAAFQQSLPRTSLDRSSPTVLNLSSENKEREKKNNFKPRSHFAVAI